MVPVITRAGNWEVRMKKGKAGVFALTFLNRPANADATPEIAAVIQKFAEHKMFKNMDMKELYETPADPAVFIDADIDFISDVMDKYNILRDGRQEICLKDSTGAILCNSPRDMCCDKKAGATYRKCILGTVCCCNMCGSYCCIGSTWCP